MFNLVLVEPEIPPNTGNVARTCVLTGTKLHLVEPLGFSISDREVKRSGLDYWSFLNLSVHSSFDQLLEQSNKSRLICFSTKASCLYHQIDYYQDDYLIFGSETRGLPEEILLRADMVARIPMIESIKRSLNLGNSVALVLYEALRQQDFPGMS